MISRFMTDEGYILYPEKRGDLKSFLSFSYGDPTKLGYAKMNVRAAVRVFGYPVWIKFDGSFLLNYGEYRMRIWQDFRMEGRGNYVRADRIRDVEAFVRRVESGFSLS